MSEDFRVQVDAHPTQGLALALINCYGKADADGELLAVELDETTILARPTADAWEQDNAVGRSPRPSPLKVQVGIEDDVCSNRLDLQPRAIAEAPARIQVLQQHDRAAVLEHQLVRGEA